MPIPHRDSLLNIAHDIDKFKATGTSERLKAVAKSYNAERRKACNVLYFAMRDTKESKTQRNIKSAYQRLRCEDD